jgi:ribosome biogenesis GTPase
MNKLLLYGWSDNLSQLKQLSGFNELPYGRVTVTHKTCYEVVAEAGSYLCELTGNILYGKSPEEYPCTGDWVIFQPTGSSKGVIVAVLPRSKTLYRKKSGTVSGRQTIAAHVDTAFIVQSLDANFSPRRIERFMVQAMDEEIQPVLILTKSDLSFNESEISDSLKHLSTKMPIFKTSIHALETIDLLRSSIKAGETVVFIGSSGVGKSSLVNALCQEELLKTSTISDSNGKGRHTSTRRELVLLNQSGVLIDTPGVREFGIVAENMDVLSSVLDIADLKESCRFMNCTHINEPGCAILAAIECGTLEQSVYVSYLKLQKESSHFSASIQEKRARQKSFTKMVKGAKSVKRER